MVWLTVVLEPDDDGFCARVPALPGCVAFAPTEKEAKSQIKNAVRLYLQSEPDEIPEGCETFKVMA